MDLIDRRAVLRLLARCRVQGCADPIAVLIDAVESLPSVHTSIETATADGLPPRAADSVKARVIPITCGGRP